MARKHKRKGPAKHGARAQAGRFHDPNDASHGGSPKRLRERSKRSSSDAIAEGEGELVEQTEVDASSKVEEDLRKALEYVRAIGQIDHIVGITGDGPVRATVEAVASLRVRLERVTARADATETLVLSMRQQLALVFSERMPPDYVSVEDCFADLQRLVMAIADEKGEG